MLITELNLFLRIFLNVERVSSFILCVFFVINLDSFTQIGGFNIVRLKNLIKVLCFDHDCICYIIYCSYFYLPTQCLNQDCQDLRIIRINVFDIAFLLQDLLRQNLLATPFQSDKLSDSLNPELNGHLPV